ncbi:uncharacterized protein LOC126832335 [Patella vulgata]|uniref:uncharacterized protein LOC126832335 n=1 Tax=Patella vulgata TaxID=6465 RepID=UPI0024A81C93|nr:uncharacterized protein LOC126832335 [Patella vulgata]
MSNRGTLLSAYRRERARQYQNCRKPIGGLFSALLLTTIAVITLNSTSLVHIPPSFQMFQQKPIQNFSEARECLLPDSESVLTKVGERCIYIQSVIASYKEPASTVISVVVNAWDGTYTSPDFVCCLRADRDVIKVMPYVFNRYSVESPFRATQFNCLVNAERLKPTHIALADHSCDQTALNYSPITYPEKDVDQLAVCAGVAYGRLVPERLTEWFELQKILGVEKVVTFTYNLDRDSMKVLKYYENDGILQIIPYNIPLIIKAKPDRGFELNQRWPPQYLNDIQMSLFDCKERLQGYRYMMVTGFHEVIIPKGKIANLYDLLEHRLRVEYQQASSFSFPVKTFITDWNKSDPDNQLFYLQYLQRTPLNTTNTRSVHIPGRITELTNTHVIPQYHYQRIILSGEMAYVHQYISCPPYLHDCYTSTRYHDGGLFFFEKILKDRMKNVPPELRQEF